MDKRPSIGPESVAAKALSATKEILMEPPTPPEASKADQIRMVSQQIQWAIGQNKIEALDL